MINNLYVRSIRIKDPEPGDESYVFGLPVVRSIKEAGELGFGSPVTFLVGENGTGKSTLLEAMAIACGFNPEGGTRNFNFATQETHSGLYRYMTVVKGVRRPGDGFFLRAESFYNVATQVDELNEGDPGLLDSYGGKSLHHQSHGESFMSLVLNRFGGRGLYFLDEPEAALSPSRQMSLLSAINALVKDDSQFFIATHSPILLAYPKSDIYVISDEGINLTPYEKTEHYMLTREFLNAPERMLKYLFEE